MKKIILNALLICLTFTACDSESEIKTENSLTTKNEESQNLENLYNELIVFSAKDAACSGKLDFIAIGEKPCGGPEKYIPYSLRIDTTEFLKKVNFYNQSKMNSTKSGILLLIVMLFLDRLLLLVLMERQHYYMKTIEMMKKKI